MTAAALVCAFDIAGTPTGIAWQDLHSPPPAEGWRWVHLNRTEPSAVKWVRKDSGLPKHVAEALLAEETRPRCAVSPEGTLLILRGVNLFPEADPDALVSIRLWIEPGRVISLRKVKLLAIDDIRRAYEAGAGPAGIGDFVIELARGLTERMGAAIQDIEEEIDDLEESGIDLPSQDIRKRLIDIRRKTIPLRRYLSPQRDALGQLVAAKPDWLDTWQQSRLREVADQVIRYVEDLDALRERASILHEELSNRLSETLNRNMYILSLVAAVFLPLGFATGLLGINVGGMPGAEDAAAFYIVCGILIIIGLAEIALFRWLKWI